jgi:rare lipoprotein A
MRSVQLTVAFTMLAVPAEAFAFSDTAGSSDTDAATPLAVRVAPRLLTLGAPMRVSGQLPASDAGMTVELQAARSPRGRWSPLATTRVGSGGHYALRASPRHSGVVRAVSLADSSTGASDSRTAVTSSIARIAAVRTADARTSARRPSVSRVAEVQVRAAMRVAHRSHGVIAGRGLSVAGRLLPGRGGRTVAVQRLSGRSWRTVARGRTGGQGGFAVRFRAVVDAHGPLRVVFAGDRDNSRATARAGMLAVYEPVVASWYEDGGTTACGFHATYGIANKSLPCGTHVRLRRGNRTVTATVDDRGPYVYGRDYDLDQSTAAALGFTGVGTIDASVQ